MNKGDFVVYVQAVGGLSNPRVQNLVEMTVDRDYGTTMSLFDGNRRHYLVGTDMVFPDMKSAVKAVAVRAQSRANTTERDAIQARKTANYWLLKLKDFD